MTVVLMRDIKKLMSKIRRVGNIIVLCLWFIYLIPHFVLAAESRGIAFIILTMCIQQYCVYVGQHEHACVWKHCSFVYAQQNEQMMFGTAASGLLQKNHRVDDQGISWISNSFSHWNYENLYDTTLMQHTIAQYLLLAVKIKPSLGIKDEHTSYQRKDKLHLCTLPLITLFIRKEDFRLSR